MNQTIYVERDEAGRIVGRYANPQPGFAEEDLRHDHPALASTGLAWSAVRQERNRRLSACDWTQLPDAPLNDEQRDAWVVYRHILRTLTEIDSPADIVWPKEPNR